MPTWNEMLEEVKKTGSPHDVLRRKYLKALSDKTGRNVLIYYSGWLQKQGVQCLGINDEDKNGFMSTMCGIDKTKGLDLILHTPGGETAATESIVDYLRSMFGDNIRAIVPQLAMSGGTMIACACKTIVMGKHSSLGPIDPQFNGIPAHGVIEEFDRARSEILSDPRLIPLWQQVIAKYSPAFIGECQKAISWSETLVKDWLSSGMLSTEPDKDTIIKNIIDNLGNHAITLSHARHMSAETCQTIGLKIEKLEDNQDLQEAVLSVHHACMLTLSDTGACKIIENQDGVAFIKVVTPMVLQAK